jgi:hypothetical protein
MQYYSTPERTPVRRREEEEEVEETKHGNRALNAFTPSNEPNAHTVARHQLRNRRLYNGEERRNGTYSAPRSKRDVVQAKHVYRRRRSAYIQKVFGGGGSGGSDGGVNGEYDDTDSDRHRGGNKAIHMAADHRSTSTRSQTPPPTSTSRGDVMYASSPLQHSTSNLIGGSGGGGGGYGGGGDGGSGSSSGKEAKRKAKNRWTPKDLQQRYRKLLEKQATSRTLDTLRKRQRENERNKTILKWKKLLPGTSFE